MVNTLSARVGRVSLYVDLPGPVMTQEVFDALQELHPHLDKLAQVIDADIERADKPA